MTVQANKEWWCFSKESLIMSHELLTVETINILREIFKIRCQPSLAISLPSKLAPMQSSQQYK